MPRDDNSSSQSRVSCGTSRVSDTKNEEKEKRKAIDLYVKSVYESEQPECGMMNSICKKKKF